MNNELERFIKEYPNFLDTAIQIFDDTKLDKVFPRHFPASQFENKRKEIEYTNSNG